ncbi:MAG: family 78 glycoside hydrolase catalytic domain [Ignavibacteriaceae bacterium]
MARYIRLQFLFMFILGHFVLGNPALKGKIYPAKLKCEYLTNPINIDELNPNLSWVLKSINPKDRNLSQSSYRILVASSKKLLNKNYGDLWDTGIIKSSNPTHVTYEGKQLHSRERCFWKVQVFDQNNEASNWSSTAEWETALLKKKDWAGSDWIGLKKDNRDSHLSSRPFQTSGMKEPVLESTHASPLLRKEFKVTKQVKNATAYVAGLGYYEFYLNGKKTGDHVLDPGQTDYDVFSLYVTYDITKELKNGENAIGVMLGNGFYGQDIAFASWLEYGKPRLRCKIWIKYKDGSEDSIVTDQSWKASTGPIMYDNVYAGESYDARKEMKGWDKPGYNDSFWQNAELVKAPNDSLRSQKLPPIKKIETVKPINIFRAKDGNWIVDLGQNIAGWAKIKIKEKRGTKITMRFAENLKPDGDELDFSSLGQFATGVLPTNIYVCKGGGWEEWEPRFTYAGFQYIEISGISNKPTEETIQGVVVHSSVKRIGHFVSSNPVLNKIYNVSLWTIVDNLHSIPTDCPDREKCGWLGDAHSTAVTDLYNFDMYRFYSKYLRDILSQLGRGVETYKHEPATLGIPTNIAPGRRICQEARVDWGAAIVLLPYYLYQYDGDIRPFKEFYPHMKDFIKYTERYESPDGIIQNGYGDWCPPGGNEKMECPPELSSTAIFYRMLDILSQVSPKLNDNDYSKWCTAKKDSVKNDFNKVYFKPISGTKYWGYGSQTADAMAYSFGMVPENKLKSFADGLIYDIDSLHNGHITTGIHGQQYIYNVLCKLGYSKVAYKLMTEPTFPSLAYTISCGFTTWPEVPLEYKNRDVKRSSSFNHPMQSGFAAFFHEGIGGIEPDLTDPGFKHFELKPYFIDELNWVKSDFDSYYGKIKSEWKRKGGDFIWDIEVPVNTTAEAYIPAMNTRNVFEGGITLKNKPEIKYIKSINGRSIFELGSGSYHFVSKINSGKK